MRLNQPTKMVFWISVVLALVGVLGQFLVAGLEPYAFYALLLGFLLMVAGVTMKGV
jgi:hypothetical protein